MQEESSLVAKNLLPCNDECMNKTHVRFYIDLSPEDAKLVTSLAVHLSTQSGILLTRADVMRLSLRANAKKEKVQA